MSGRIQLDDVTLRMLGMQGVDPAAWLEALDTHIGRDDHRNDGTGMILGAALRLRDKGPAVVHDTRIRLSDEVQYTRGDVSPGPQLTIEGTFAETVMLALTGEAATRVIDHRALEGSTIGGMFTSSGCTYADLDMPFHLLDTKRDLDQEKRVQDARIDAMLSRCGSAGETR